MSYIIDVKYIYILFVNILYFESKKVIDLMMNWFFFDNRLIW